jgi:NADH dehydrogenase [ubiquinone] 1 alpha subcomplex assembly factor 3
MSFRLLSQLLGSITTTRLLSSRAKQSTHCRLLPVTTKGFNTSRVVRDSSFTNLLADDNPPAVQVSSISDTGIQLADGLVLPGACVFLEGKVFLWDVPESTVASKIREERWKGWRKERFQLFEVIAPRPGLYLRLIFFFFLRLMLIYVLFRDTSSWNWEDTCPASAVHARVS